METSKYQAILVVSCCFPRPLESFDIPEAKRFDATREARPVMPAARPAARPAWGRKPKDFTGNMANMARKQRKACIETTKAEAADRSAKQLRKGHRKFGASQENRSWIVCDLSHLFLDCKGEQWKCSDTPNVMFFLASALPAPLPTHTDGRTLPS